MRPQDVPVLLKIAIWEDKVWSMKALAQELYLSPTEISFSLNRSMEAGLIDHHKEKVQRHAFLEFLLYGFRYVFPAHIGGPVKGIPTALSHPYFQNRFRSEFEHVWPYYKGTSKGLSIAPLYEKQVEAALEDERLHQALAMTDVLRVGRKREIQMAADGLESLLT